MGRVVRLIPYGTLEEEKKIEIRTQAEGVGVFAASNGYGLLQEVVGLEKNSQPFMWV